MSVFVITIVALLAATLALSIGLMVVALKLRNAASRLAELKKSLRDTRRASANFRTATEHANDGLVIQNMDPNHRSGPNPGLLPDPWPRPWTT